MSSDPWLVITIQVITMTIANYGILFVVPCHAIVRANCPNVEARDYLVLRPGRTDTRPNDQFLSDLARRRYTCRQ